jgi:ElaA protein
MATIDAATTNAVPSARAAAPALRWQWSRLDALAAAEVYAILRLRQEVFVVEQACAFLDADGCDDASWHLAGWTDAAEGPALVAYLRVVDPGVKYPEPSIGRVVTAPSHRRLGLGRGLMREGLARAASLWPRRALRIGAQQRLERFYAELGFRTVSAPYDEDGIPHVEMLRDVG